MMSNLEGAQLGHKVGKPQEDKVCLETLGKQPRRETEVKNLSESLDDDGKESFQNAEKRQR